MAKPNIIFHVHYQLVLPKYTCFGDKIQTGTDNTNNQLFIPDKKKVVGVHSWHSLLSL